MTAKLDEDRFKDRCLSKIKEQYLVTGGGKIVCLRCQAKSTRTKMQCGRPALAISSKQLCQYHGGRPHTAETLKRISEANTLHGQSTKIAKEQYRHDSALMHELEDAVYFLEMAQGPRTRGRKPAGYRGVYTKEDVLRLIHERLLHMV
jgi:hypothetical protein